MLDANAIPVAVVVPIVVACPWPISMHKFIHTFAKYNLQMPNTNAMPIAISMAVPIAIDEAVPMVNLNTQIHSYFC